MDSNKEMNYTDYTDYTEYPVRPGCRTRCRIPSYPGPVPDAGCRLPGRPFFGFFFRKNSKNCTTDPWDQKKKS